MNEMRDIYLVGDEGAMTGFRLAGLDKTYSINEGNVDEVYDSLKDKDAVIMLTYSASTLLGDRVDKLRKRSFLLTIPDRPGEKYTTVRNLIKDTVGFDLRGQRHGKG